MLRRIAVVALTLAACCPSYIQAADKGPTFEVASVKPAAMPKPDGQGRVLIAGPAGGPGTKDPGRIHYPYISLKNLLMNAYDVKSNQIQGPSWLDTERYEVNATMPPDTTKEQFRSMLQNLIAERFRMTMHRETKDLPIYSLAVGKNGPKMKESAPASTADDDSGPKAPPLPPQPKIGADGFPEVPIEPGGKGLFMMMMPGRARIVGQQQTMQNLADRLTAQLGRPVSDATGLTAKYDFVLTFSSEGMHAPGPTGQGGGGMMVAVAVAPHAGGGGDGPASVPESADPLPDIFTAVKEQLGLTLEPKRGPVELIVVDRIEKTPTEN